jgi:hypothetical protein
MNNLLNLQNKAKELDKTISLFIQELEKEIANINLIINKKNRNKKYTISVELDNRMDLLSIELDFYIEDETRKFYVLSYSIGNLENLDYGYILEECRSVYQEEFK